MVFFSWIYNNFFFFSLQTLSPQFFLLVFPQEEWKQPQPTLDYRNTTLPLLLSPLASVPCQATHLPVPSVTFFIVVIILETCVSLLLFHALLLFSHSGVSNSLRPWGLQHTRLPCLHYLPEFAQTQVLWISDASNHLVLCSSPPFSSCPQSFPASGSFPVSQLF